MLKGIDPELLEDMSRDEKVERINKLDFATLGNYAIYWYSHSLVHLMGMAHLTVNESISVDMTKKKLMHAKQELDVTYNRFLEPFMDQLNRYGGDTKLHVLPEETREKISIHAAELNDIYQTSKKRQREMYKELEPELAPIPDYGVEL